MKSSRRQPAIAAGHNNSLRRIGLRNRFSVPAARRGAPRPQVIPAIKLTRILVPVDFSRGSAKALCYASAIAKVHGAKIILLHITKPISLSADFGYGTVHRQVTDAAQMKKDRSRLRRFATNHLLPGAIENIIIRSGNASEEIISTAKDVPADLIVLYAHEGTDSNFPIAWHKTAEQVIRSTRCPVLVVRSHEHDFISRPENDATFCRGYDACRFLPCREGLRWNA